MKQKPNEKPWPLGVVQKVVHHDTKDEFHFGTKSLLIFRCKTCQSILPSHLANITLVLLPVTNNHLHLWPRFLIIFARILSFFIQQSMIFYLLGTLNLLFSQAKLLKSSRNKKDLNDVTAAPVLVFFLLLEAEKKTLKTGQLWHH